MFSCSALTNDHETYEHGTRTTSLESTTTTNKETCTDSTTTEIRSACAIARYVDRNQVTQEKRIDLRLPKPREKNRSSSGENLHGNHLHVSPLQVPVQLVGAIGSYDIMAAINRFGALTIGDLLLRVGTEFGTVAHRCSCNSKLDITVSFPGAGRKLSTLSRKCEDLSSTAITGGRDPVK